MGTKLVVCITAVILGSALVNYVVYNRLSCEITVTDVGKETDDDHHHALSIPGSKQIMRRSKQSKILTPFTATSTPSHDHDGNFSDDLPDDDFENDSVPDDDINRVNGEDDKPSDDSLHEAVLENIKASGKAGVTKSKKTSNNFPESLGHIRRVNVSTSLRQLGPEVFDAFPEPFSPLFKNPCWALDSNQMPLYCLPYFYLAGMPKCGTSDLWGKLMGHPQIIKRKGKELHWWTRFRIEKLGKGYPALNSDPRSYYRRFAKAIANFKHGIGNGQDASKVITGDGSASTLWDNSHWRLFYGREKHNAPPHVNSELIGAIQPNARAIVILRDPVERLYSDYMYFNNKTKSPEEFHERVKAAIPTFHKCVERMGLRACTYSTSSISNSVRLQVSIYIVYIEDWLKSFPRSALRVITTESWNENCTAELAGLHQFLELEPVSFVDLNSTCGGKTVNARSSDKSSLGLMFPETRQLLTEFFSPFNKELANKLGDDRFLWT